MVKDIYALEGCQEERDSLYSLISIKDERIEVKDSLLGISVIKLRQKDVIIGQDSVIIVSQADEIKNQRTSKKWITGSLFTVGGISIIINIYQFVKSLVK